MKYNKFALKKLIYGAVCLALCLLLPFVTGGIPVIGKMLSPMHFPVIVCGFVAGPIPGFAVGAISPLLRNIIFGSPAPFYPRVIRMVFELSAYGFFSGVFYKLLPKKTYGIYISLIGAMLAGRIFYALSWLIISVFDSSNPFNFYAVIANTVLDSFVGIIFDIIFIPPIVSALKK